MFDWLWWMLLGEWKSLLGVFRFSGWNCFKNYEKVEEGEC